MNRGITAVPALLVRKDEEIQSLKHKVKLEYCALHVLCSYYIIVVRIQILNLEQEAGHLRSRLELTERSGQTESNRGVLAEQRLSEVKLKKWRK